jgi:transposase-like protein
MPTLTQYVRHARRFGTEGVGQTAAREWRRRLPSPVDLTWMAPGERERILDERQWTFAAVKADCLRLQAELDAIDRSDAEEAERRESMRRGGPRKNPHVSRRRRSAGERLELVRVLLGEGLTTGEIATKLGVGFGHARRLRKAALNGHEAPPATRASENGVRTPKTPAYEGVNLGG